MIFRKGEGFKEGFLFLKHTPNRLGESRCGIIVSRKISKKATIRNKIKRRIRAVISQKLQEIKKGKDFILVALPGLETDGFCEIEETINRLLKKANLL